MTQVFPCGSKPASRCKGEEKAIPVRTVADQFPVPVDDGINRAAERGVPSTLSKGDDRFFYGESSDCPAHM